MSKLRLLVCSEASVLSTGYAIYAKEMLTRLHNSGKYEIAEFARYIHSSDPRLQDVPWRVYGNLPDKNNQAEVDHYNSNGLNVFGAWKFEDVVLDFLPNVVFGYADYWMDEHQSRSPLRPYFNLVWMPTVDAYPQNKQWIAGHSECDAIFTYSDWAIDVLKKQSGGKVQPICSLAAGADTKYSPVQNKEEHKKKYGLENYKIIGTVMRNQRRKLFPDLFESFRKFLDISGRNDVLLYCHTSYPDKHPWNIPELINEYSLSNKVLLTYRCTSCGNTFPSFFNDIALVCPRCNQLTANTSSVQQGCTVEFLREVYNLFDLYVQYANSEGQGLPQCEAAACGVPVASVDYSAMSDVVRKLGGIPIKVKALYRELETGCMRAIPDNDEFANLLYRLFCRPETSLPLEEIGQRCLDGYNQNYGYDKSAAKFSEYLDSLNVDELNNRWRQPPNIFNFAKELPDNLSNSDLAAWLIINVLGEPNKIGSYMHTRLIKELNYGFTTGGMGGFYINESSMFFAENPVQKFDAKLALDNFASMREHKNFWENRRWERVNGR